MLISTSVVCRKRRRKYKSNDHSHFYLQGDQPFHCWNGAWCLQLRPIVQEREGKHQRQNRDAALASKILCNAHSLLPAEAAPPSARSNVDTKAAIGSVESSAGKRGQLVSVVSSLAALATATDIFLGQLNTMWDSFAQFCPTESSKTLTLRCFEMKRSLGTLKTFA